MINPGEVKIEERADFFKALGHPIRLLILNLVRQKPRHGEELALILSLNPATISHHLAILGDAGMLNAQKDQYYQIYTLEATAFTPTIQELVFTSHDGLGEGVEEDAYRKKVLKTFLRRGRLVSIPAQLKKRQVILEKIAMEFEPGLTYTEREVNILLLNFHDDVASLRRGLVEFGLLEREKSIYQRKTIETV